MASNKIFSIEGKGLKLDTAAQIEPHIRSLRESSDVEEVRLAGNTLGVEASVALAKVIETKKTLRIANFADIFTSRLLSEIPPALSALLTALLSLPKLHTVNLNDNAFGLNTQAPLVDFISKHVPLQHLILNNNGLGPHAGILIADALSELAERKKAARTKGETVPELETVICGRNRLENGSMEAWAKAYSAHVGMREVKMVQNGIRPEGISTLLKNGLRHCSKLQVLDLQDNTFTRTASVALASILTGWKELKELGLGDCLLSARGGTLLAKSLHQGSNKEIEILRLQFNDINAEGLKEFSSAVKDHLPALRRIELNGNKFSQEDPSLEVIREILEARKEKVDIKESEEWGVDSLSDLEEESDEEDEDEDEESEVENENEKGEKAERLVKEADRAENEPVAQKDDKSVDALASQLDKTEI